MTRDLIKNGSMLVLKTKNGKKSTFIVEKVESESGGNCLCYKVHTKEQPRIALLLKEFYPKHINGVYRDTETGELVLPSDGQEGEEVEQRRQLFIASVGFIQNLTNDDRIARYICAPSSTELLYGNGTVFFLNSYYNKSVMWSQLLQENIVSVLTCGIAIAEFCSVLHEMGLCYVDLKPDNVLIRRSLTNEPDYGNPMFFDFDSVLPFGHYCVQEVNWTVAYLPKDIQSICNPGSKETVGINAGFDISILGKVLREKLDHEQITEMIQGDLREQLDSVLDKMENPEEGMNMKVISGLLREIRDSVLHAGREREKTVLEKKIEKYKLFYNIILGITLSAYGIITAVFLMLGMNSHWNRTQVYLSSPVNLLMAAVILVILTMLTMAAKFQLLNQAAQRAASEVASDAFDKQIYTDEKDTFLIGGRSNATYQDKSFANKSRQRWRHVLWLLLGIGIIVFGTVFSLAVNSFPVFLAFGFTAIIIFMYADYIPAETAFYKSAVEILGVADGLDRKNVRGNEKELFFYDEYMATGGTFSLDPSFHDEAKLSYYDQSQLNVNHIKKYAEEGSVNYNYEIIRQIYKMSWDRRKNTQLIINLVLLLISLFMVYLIISMKSGTMKGYSRIPDVLYPLITLIMILINGAVNVIQIIKGLKTEKLNAHLAYCSRFVRNEFLKGILEKDILLGRIVPIDAARGIYQYNAKIFEEPGFIDSKKKINGLESSVLLHHLVLSQQRRMLITLGLSSGIMFAILVWHFHLVFTLAFIIPAAIILFACVINDRLLYNILRKRVCRRIECLEPGKW